MSSLEVENDSTCLTVRIVRAIRTVCSKELLSSFVSINFSFASTSWDGYHAMPAVKERTLQRTCIVISGGMSVVIFLSPPMICALQIRTTVSTQTLFSSLLFSSSDKEYTAGNRDSSGASLDIFVGLSSLRYA
jgi:hypothetical protein